MVTPPRADNTRFLRIVGPLEACTYGVLLVVVVWFRGFAGPDYTHVVGPIHGVAFCAYFVAVVHAREELDWDARTTRRALLAAIVPAGGWLVGRRLARTEETAT